MELKERTAIIIQKGYVIDTKMILMMGEYDSYGKLCARVMKGETSFLIDRSPLHLLNDALMYIGFDLRGAMAGAKRILDKRSMCPIMVNPYQGICLFPSHSPFNADCIWFNPEHIVTTKAVGRKTKVELSNGHSILIDQRLYAFNDKLQTAIQLKRISRTRGNHPSLMTYFVVPKKGLQLSKEETGKYNFGILDENNDTSGQKENGIIEVYKEN
ncbi:MAG TPA: competence protein ComK [Neobacillus sp.]